MREELNIFLNVLIFKKNFVIWCENNCCGLVVVVDVYVYGITKNN